MLKKFIPLAFILLWIVPVGWVGLMRSNYPLYPGWIAPLFRVSGIFESAPSRWRIFFVEAQDKESGNWHEIDEKLLFAQTPLGDRTRFQQLMNEIENSKPKQASIILEWITRRLPQAGYSLSQIKAIRIVQFGIPPESFLKSTTLVSVYNAVNAIKMPRVVIASFSITPTFQ